MFYGFIYYSIFEIMVSFEKAKALKIANFPQPLPGFGQVWYDLDGQAVILSKVIIIDKSYSNIKKVVCQSEEASHLKYDYDLFLSGEVIFAPTETDIFNWVKALCQEKRDPGFYREWKGIFMEAVETNPENTDTAVADAALLFLHVS